MGDGYAITRGNTIDVCLVRKSADSAAYETIYSPWRYPDGGPINGYSVVDGWILLRTYGRRQRGSSPGDSYEYPDRSRTHFYAVCKPDSRLVGPLSVEEFALLPAVQRSGPVEWAVPRNPSRTHSLLVVPVFVAACVVAFASRFYYAAIPLALLLAWAGLRLWRRVGVAHRPR